MKKIHEVIKAIDLWVENHSYSGGLFSHSCAITKDNSLFVTFVCTDSGVMVEEEWSPIFIEDMDISNVDLYTQNILQKLKGDYYRKKAKLDKRSKYIEKILNN